MTEWLNDLMLDETIIFEVILFYCIVFQGDSIKFESTTTLSIYEYSQNDHNKTDR